MREFARYAEADIPTHRGPFRLVVYRVGNEEHLAMVRGHIFGGEAILARVHSECLTGETLGSLRCDCRDQLEHALDRIADEGRGVVVYMRQEGRGIGLGNKIRAYALQDQGIDTVDANLALGFAADERSFEIAGRILHDLGVKSVRMMTNNPDKLEGVRRAGVEIVAQEPHWVPGTEFSEAYLATKKAKLGHIDGEQSDSVASKDKP
jgi:3,4-dihydroxy 2-butanone 4-phosphate synthase / GTP cyclohydrolase II